MNQGRIIEYIDQGRFACTLCLQDRGNKLHLLTTSNREINLSVKRAFLISGSTVNISKPREELLESLKQAEKTRIDLKTQIDVKELWELIMDERESFDHKYLAQLVFGQDISDDHLSALVRALFENRLYFKMKDGFFVQNSEERVDQIIRQKKEEALKEEKLNQGSTWLSDLKQGKKPDDPPYKEDVINLLVQLALYGNEAQDFKYGKKMLSRAGISDIRETKDLLIRLGVWEEDENLDLIRSGVEISFSEKQLAESVSLAGLKIDYKGNEDLRDLPIMTIDGPLTSDYDDAVSLDLDGNFLSLGIHIVDVSAVIMPHSILDREAKDRGSSYYFPRKQIPMFPPVLSQETLSLKLGCDRLAVSLLIRFDKNADIIDYRFVPSVINVKRQFTYEEANKIIGMKGRTNISGTVHVDYWTRTLNKLYQLAQRLYKKRMDQDALGLSLPELEIKFNADSSLSLKLVPQDTPSRMIIAELMILYNWLTARFCVDNKIPVLFRSQAEPSERFSIGESGYFYYVFQQRRKLSRLRIGTTPNRHSGLGLDAYVHATSPIRRYLDLVVQRQIKSFIVGTESVCDEKKLEEIRVYIEPIIKNFQRLKQNRVRYWVLKFLSQYPGKKCRALVLDEVKSKYRIVLNDFLLVAQIKKRSGIILKPGEEILVEVKKADPWEDLLELVYSDE